MLKDFLWNVFENSGNIEVYVFYKQLDEDKNVRDQSFSIKNEVALSS